MYDPYMRNPQLLEFVFFFFSRLFQVVLPNINKTSMQAVLDYLYTKQLSSTQELDILELIALANRFCLPHLVALAGKDL